MLNRSRQRPTRCARPDDRTRPACVRAAGRDSDTACGFRPARGLRRADRPWHCAQTIRDATATRCPAPAAGSSPAATAPGPTACPLPSQGQALAARRQPSAPETIELKLAPQAQRQPAPAPLARPAQPRETSVRCDPLEGIRNAEYHNTIANGVI